MYINIVILLIMLVICVITDLKYDKIKNIIVVTCSTVGFINYLISFDSHLIIQSITGAILPIIIFYIFFLMKMLGAGDIKLFSAIGIIMGLNFCIKVIVCSFFYASIVAIILLCTKKNKYTNFINLKHYFKNIIITRIISPYTSVTGTIKIHLSIEITLATISILLINLF